MNEWKSTAQLRQQLGSKGYYAEIEIAAEKVNDGEEVQIGFDINVDPRWREAISVGLRIGWKSLQSKYTAHQKLKIVVNQLKWQPVDTTEIMVVYVAAKSIISLFENSSDRGPGFLLQFGTFVFGR